MTRRPSAYRENWGIRLRVAAGARDPPRVSTRSRRPFVTGLPGGGVAALEAQATEMNVARSMANPERRQSAPLIPTLDGSSRDEVPHRRRYPDWSLRFTVHDSTVRLSIEWKSRERCMGGMTRGE